MEEVPEVAEIRANNVPDDFVRRFDIKRAERGRLSIREAVIEAIELWMANEGERKPQDAESQPLSEEHQLLDLILQTDAQAAEMIRQQLQMIAKLLELKVRRPKEKRAV
jgi:hypothetical protein